MPTEPWENSYVLDGATQELLVQLAERGPLTEAAVRVELVSPELLGELAGDEESARSERELLGGLADFVTSFGKSPAFGEAIQLRQARQREQRLALRWADVPPGERALVERRAEAVLGYASMHGWLERSGDAWQITDSGRQLLDEGGFDFR